MACYCIRVFNPKFLHLVFLAGKKNKNKEAVTIPYSLFPPKDFLLQALYYLLFVKLLD